jgi:hypothetical protein
MVDILLSSLLGGAAAYLAGFLLTLSIRQGEKA